MALQYGIDLGNRAIKVVAGRKKGPVFELHRAFSIPLDIGDESEQIVLDAVPQLTEALGKSPGARFGVSGKDLIIRYTQVPQVPLWRLKRLMEFEVHEMAEQAGDSLTCDYNIINVPGSESLDETVLVAVVKERFLEDRFKAVSEACGDPNCGMPASVALFNGYLHSGDLYEDEFVFLVDIGDRNVEFVLQKDGEILFARNIAAGGHGLTEAVSQTFGVSMEQAEDIKATYGNVTPKGKASYESSKEEKVANALIGPTGQLASMIQSSLAFSRAQTKIKDLSVGRILLSGGGANLRGLDEYLAQTFNCPVERFLPEGGLDLGPLDGEEAAEFERDPGRFAVALGLALTGVNQSSFVVDLVPAHAKKRREFVGRTLFMWLSGAAALLFLVLTYLNLSGEASELKKQSFKENRKAAKAKRDREEYERESARIRDLQLRRSALNRLTQASFAQQRAHKLIQKAWQEGVWIETVGVRRVSVPLNKDKPKGPKKARFMVDARGEIISTAMQAEGALDEMVKRIQEADPTCSVTIKDRKGGASSGSKLQFTLQLDFFPDAKEAN